MRRIDRRSFLLLAGSILAAPLLAKNSDMTGRNLVFVLIDDLGAMDLACCGSAYYKTPHIDSLAEKGTIFTQAYAASGVCSPTRASIVTGRYPQRLNITTYIPGPSQMPYARLLTPPIAVELPRAELGYAKLLAAGGLRSMHAGKWHLRDSPQVLGFDEVYDNSRMSTDDPWSVADLTDKVCSFIKRNRDRRFLAVLSHHSVHVPLHEKKENIERWKDVPAGDNGQRNPTMAAMIESVDQSVGRLMATLSEFGLDGNTAVVFFSDNGGLPMWYDPAQKRRVVVTSNRPLRGGKSQLYEGGIRVPLIISTPWIKDQKRECDVPVISNDLAPTFLSLMDCTHAPKQHLDGVDLTPLLRGDEIEQRNLFWYYPHYQAATPCAAVRSGEWKLLHFYETSANELFHLPTDPSENTDLSSTFPKTTTVLLGILKKHLDNMHVELPAKNPHYDPARSAEKEHGRHPKVLPSRPSLATDASQKRMLIDILKEKDSLELPLLLKRQVL